jgi:hypothetical protein
MAKFGGDSHFGGDSNFGGADSRLIKYYRALKSLDPPGVYKDDDASLHYHLAKVDARGLANGQSLLDHLELELFPHTAEQTIEKWEESYRLTPKPSATIQQRRDACVARWRATASSSPKHLRQALASVLNPTTAFRDTCDDSSVSWRYTQVLGNGTVAEDTTDLTISCGNTDQCDWTAAQQNAPRLLIKNVDRSDDCTISAKIIGLTGGGTDGAWGGVCLYHSATNAVCLQVEEISSAINVRLWHITGGVRYSGSATALGFTPAAGTPCWLRLSRIGSTYYFYYGQSLSSLTTLRSLSTGLMPQAIKHLGVFAGNSAADSYPACDLDIDQIEISYGKTYNNVELIETTLALATAGDDDDIFRAFIHRDPEDDGNYDIFEAQQICDRMKQAHTLITVGESDCFLCDDDYSLTDRDVLGS